MAFIKMKIKKQNILTCIKIVVLVTFVITLIAPNGNDVLAQGNEQTLTLSFEQMGFSALQVTSNLASASGVLITNGNLDFSLPYHWMLVGNEANYIDLHYSIDLVRDDSLNSSLNPALPKMEIYIDGTLLSASVPQAGSDQRIKIQIPPDVINQRTSNNHTLTIVYLNTGNCLQNVEYVLTVHNDSSVTFGYIEPQPVLNLIDFPRPLVNDSSLFPENVYFVFPTNVNDAELEAAATLSQAIGDKGRGGAGLNILFDTDLTLDNLPSGNLIVVGQPSTNQFLSTLYQETLLPTSISDQGMILSPSGHEISPNDGVLQIINYDNTIILAVTGNSDEALVKAATALASANPSYGLSGDLSVIHDVLVEGAANLTPDFEFNNISFGDIGIRDVSLKGIGTQIVGGTFYLPYNWKILDNPSIVVDYANSAVLSAGSSVINVELNNNLVGSIPLTDTTLGKKKSLIQLGPEQFILGGRNRLNLRVTMDDNLQCGQYNNNLAWVQIFSDGSVEIPHESLSLNSEEMPQLTNPFYYLLSSAELSKILFVRPEPITLEELNGIVQISYLLGNEQRGAGVSLSVISGSGYLPENYPDFHTILIGRPTTNSAIAMLNEQLPQPFVSGEDMLLQDVGNVKYVLPPTYSVGVVQAFVSPFNTGKGITVISGTTDEALSWSLNVMENADLVRKINGDVAFVYQENIESIVSSAATHKTVETVLENVTGQNVEIETGTETPVPVVNTQESQTNESLFNWRLVIGLILFILILVGVAGIVLSFTRRSRKS